jgi:hypothetical protein
LSNFVHFTYAFLGCEKSKSVAMTECGDGAEIQNAIEVKRVEVNAVQLKLNEKFGEFGGICEETFWLVVPSSQRTVEELTKIEQLKKEPSANLAERKELEKVAELKGLCEQVRLPLPKLLGPSYFDG